jgi:hypothetical protein
MKIVFEGTKSPIDVPDQGEFLAALAGAAVGWPFRKSNGSARAVASVRALRHGYQILSGDEEIVETSAVGAACGVVVDLVKAYIAENPNRLCLHCGSVAFAGKLVVFPSEYRAGKSTLVARLAAVGHQVFGDDVLPLSDDDRSGIALGLAPRLRVPLPANASHEFKEFAAKHEGPSDKRYRYLRLPADRLAVRGAELPLGAIVLLDRQAEGPASIEAASRSAALRSLIARNFARSDEAGHLLDRLQQVMERLPLFRLRYADLDDAADLLDRTFSTCPPLRQATARAELSLERPAIQTQRGSDADPEAASRTDFLLRRNPAVKLCAIDGELFLVDADGEGIHHLNPVGAGVWNLLADPISEREAVEVLAGAFPDVERARIERDIAILLAELIAGNFVLWSANEPISLPER